MIIGIPWDMATTEELLSTRSEGITSMQKFLCSSYLRRVQKKLRRGAEVDVELDLDCKWLPEKLFIMTGIAHKNQSHQRDELHH